MKKWLPSLLVPCILLIFLMVTAVAAGKPDVIRHEATYLEQSLHIIVQWQSENPVTSVKITAGKEQKEIKVDEYDNKRNPSGYEGEVTVVVPVDPNNYPGTIPYVVQLEDDLRIRSNLINGRADLPKPQTAVGGMYGQQPMMGGGAPGHDAWGQGHLHGHAAVQQPGMMPGSPGAVATNMVDKLLGVMERHDVPPSTDNIKVNILSTENVSFSSKANDDKGLREVNIRVYDNTGKEVGTQQLANLGKVWQGTSQTFSLQPGNYRVTLQAIDSAGNTSKERTAVFTLGNATPPPVNMGSLTVSILPDAALKAGAQWRITGREWAATGSKLDLPPAKYKVEFKEIAGLTTPASQDVELIAGQNAQITGIYTEVAAKKGTVLAVIKPAAVTKLGAKWRLDGGAWQESGMKLETTEGPHKVEFTDVASWVKPTSVDITVVADKDNTATGAYGRLYTTNNDFQEGTLVGLENQTVRDQLQLSKTSTTLPFIWVPNSGEGTISKINTTTGVEIGRYRVGPGNADPSRTTVDLQGNCWVGNRGIGTVVKVGLSENGQCVDRNGNGKIDTSNSSAALAWGEDECVLFEVVMADNGGTFVPGKASGYNGSGPRGVAIDSSNNVWASTFNAHRLYYIDGKTGRILDKVDTSAQRHTSYGLVVDKQGKVWSSGHYGNHVMRYNPQDRSIKTIPTRHMVYGMGIDKNNHLFAAGLSYNRVTRINTVSETIELDGISVAKNPRSIAITDDGSVWVTNYQYGSVTRLTNDLQSPAVIQSKGELAGVAVDSNGKVWAVDYYDRLIRINPATNSVEKEIVIPGFHYSYSDMTGIVARTMTTQIGSWTAIYDSESDSTLWGKLIWKSTVPPGASLKVKVRSSKDKTNWSAWEDAASDVEPKATPAGRYLQVETTLQLISGEVSPILNDLTVNVK